MRTSLALLLLGAAVANSGCGGSDETTNSAAPVAHETKAPDWTVLEKTAGRYSTRLIIPSGPPPKKKLVIKDLRVGGGRKLESGHQFKVNYVAVKYRSGELRQNSWKAPFYAAYRLNELVDSFEQGLGGMRVGGIRELISPASLAYKEGALVYLIRLIWVGKKGWN
jgi:hypothetical protein